ncbi:PKD domain protein [Chitinispirillum alkaliphilum]|nr:PKD domain protein [Chitinispirillum alkaliphilum]
MKFSAKTASMLILLSLLSCSLNRKSEFEVQIVVGEANLKRSSGAEPLRALQGLGATDTVEVGAESKIKIESRSGGVLYVLGPALFSLQPFLSENVKIMLHKGEVCAILSEEESFYIQTPYIQIESKASQISVYYREREKGTVVAVLSGEAYVGSGGQMHRLVSCETASFSNQEKNDISHTNPAVYEHLKNWVGISVVEKPVRQNNCVEKFILFEESPSEEPEFQEESEESEENQISVKQYKVAPRQVSVDKPPLARLNISPRLGEAGEEILLDAGLSRDAQGLAEHLMVRWDLNGDGVWDLPQEGEYSSKKQILHTFDHPGVYNVSVEVRDRMGRHSVASKQLEIKEAIRVEEISGPLQAYTGQQIEFALKISSGLDRIDQFRWEFNKEGFGKIEKTHQPSIWLDFDQPGEYMLSVYLSGEPESEMSKQFQFRIVDSPVEVSAGGPYSGRTYHPVVFEGKVQSSFRKVEKMEWDFTGTGVSDFSGVSSVSEYIFNEPGVYRAVFTAEFDDGTRVADTAIVTIEHRPPLANAGEDVASRPGRRVRLAGTGDDPEGRIIRYEWDFGGNGEFDWSSGESGEVTHRFDEYTKAVLKVTNEYGVSALDTVNIIICPPEMALIEDGKYCIDIYEWPNKRGTVPEVNVTYQEAKDSCERVGKRLCTPQEWEMACRDSRDRNSYPYGRRYDTDKCNTLGNPFVKNQIAPSGTFPDCAGRSGIYDMSGNVAEWTFSEDRDKAFVYGGFYQSGENESRCDSKLLLEKNRNYFYTGFRCCK